VEYLEVGTQADISTGEIRFVATQRLGADVPLPAEAVFFVPAGSGVTFAGEQAGDVARMTSSTTVEVPGTAYDAVTVRLERSRVALVQAVLPNLLPESPSVITAAVEYVTPTDVEAAVIQVAVPAGAEVTSSTPGAQRVVREGDLFYYTEYSDVGAGETLSMAVTIALQVPETHPPSPWALLVVVMLIIAVVAVPLVMRRRKRPT